MSILVITTGGTIGAMPYPDAKAPPKIVSMPPKGKDLVQDMLSQDFAASSCRCIAMEPRDSQLIETNYRNTLIKIIDDAPETCALVTHGTDTILKTAEYFYDAAETGVGLNNKTVLLTGAMVPLANGPQSDGMMNLKFALKNLTEGKLAPGIYIVLSDYVDAEKREGWVPKLYPFAPGRYEKYYDPADGSHNRIVSRK
jgi:L-asparaginase